MKETIKRIINKGYKISFSSRYDHVEVVVYCTVHGTKLKASDSVTDEGSLEQTLISLEKDLDRALN